MLANVVLSLKITKAERTIYGTITYKFSCVDIDVFNVIHEITEINDKQSVCNNESFLFSLLSLNTFLLSFSSLSLFSYFIVLLLLLTSFCVVTMLEFKHIQISPLINLVFESFSSTVRIFPLSYYYLSCLYYHIAILSVHQYQ